MIYSPNYAWQSLCKLLQSFRTNGDAFLSLTLLLGMPVLLAGCGQKSDMIRGIAPAGRIITVREVTALAETKTIALKTTNARQVVLRGEMIEKCPVAGCWFKLRDKTGVVRVDTKAAGFVVSDIPLHQQLTVQGSLVPNTQGEVAATGIRY